MKNFIYIIMILLLSFNVSAYWFYDNFTRGDTAVDKQNYSVTYGASTRLNITNNVLNTTSSDGLTMLNIYNLTNFTYKARAISTSSATRGNQIIFRYNGQGGTREYYLYYVDTGIKFYYVNITSFYTIGSTVGYTIQPNDNITVVANGNNFLYYINGALKRNDTVNNITRSGTIGWRADTSYNEVDDLNITSSEIPGDVPPAPPQTNYTIVNVQTPADINTSVLYFTVNSSVNATNSSMLDNLTNPYMFISTKITTTLNNGCAIFQQRDCLASSTTVTVKNMTKINNTAYFTSFADNEFIPAYYAYNYSYINNNPGDNYTNYQNNNIRFNIYNFSNNTNDFFIGLEFQAINLSSSTASMLIYYCNSSYSTGNPLLSSNCVLLDSFVPTTLWSHVHNFSLHQYIPVKIQNVTKTQMSYIIFVSPNLLPQNGWSFRYVNSSSYDNTSFNIGNLNTWSNTSKIFDIHIHPFFQTDYIQYFTTFNNGTSDQANSSVTIDFFNLTNFPPSAPDIITPGCNANYTVDYTGASNTIIFYNWTASTSVNNFVVTYAPYLCNGLTYLCIQFNTTNNTNSQQQINYSYIANNLLVTGTNNYFYTKIVATDSVGQSDTGIQNCFFNICQNIWVKDTNACLSGVRTITYSDSEHCSSAYGVPADNGTIEECTSIVYQQQVFQQDEIVLMILAFFLIISTVCAITVHEAFFGLNALLMGLIMTVFIYYGYDTISIIACVFMIIVFSGAWILVGRRK